VERVAELQRFVDANWRRGHVLARDERLLRWQHSRERDDARLAVLVAEDGRTMLGMLGFVEFDACVGNQRVRGAWMTNWLIVPEARGRRLGLALLERVLGSEYEFVGALAANSATRHVLGGSGFAEVGMHRWVRVFDLDALRELLGGRAYPEKAWSAWAATASASSAVGHGEEFVGACRDEAFVRHRYDEHPRFEYEVVREGGFAACRVEQVQGVDARVLRIVDFLGGEALAAGLVEAGRRAGAVFADFSCTSARFGAPLETAGFQREDRLPAELPARFQPLDFSDRPVVSCFCATPRLGVDFGGGDLYVTRADSDLDRPN
jgi:hypothetical protein